MEIPREESLVSRTGDPQGSGNPVCRERYLLQDDTKTTSDEALTSSSSEGSSGDFYEQVYDQLHGLASRQMRSQGPGHTLQATALVSELYLKLGTHDSKRWKDRDHFIAMAARAMRSILVDHARSKGRQKRSADGVRIALDEAAADYTQRSGDLVALDEALSALGENDPGLVELVELRFFGGCSMEECARFMGKSLRTIQRDWAFAKGWLRRRLEAVLGTPPLGPTTDAEVG